MLESIWDGKLDKVKRNTMIKSYEEARLQMSHMQSYLFFSNHAG